MDLTYLANQLIIAYQDDTSYETILHHGTVSKQKPG